MAEAAVAPGIQNRFFCHQCSVEINPKLPEYTCPRCQSGFIEELTEDLSDSAPNNLSSPSSNNDPGAQFAELFGRSFLQSLHQHIDHNPSDRNNSGSDSEDVTDTPLNNDNSRRQHRGPALMSFEPFFQPPVPGTRISFLHGRAPQNTGQPSLDDPSSQALQSILQTVLSGLMGGGGGGAVQQGGAHFPFGGMFNMYGNPRDYAWGHGGLDNIITQLLNQIEGTGPPPATKEDIAQLQDLSIEKHHIEKTMQCSVCMEDFQLEEKVKRMPCQHMFHKDCIEPWLELHGTCPVCRKPLSGEESEHSSTNQSESSSGNNNRSQSGSFFVTNSDLDSNLMNDSDDEFD